MIEFSKIIIDGFCSIQHLELQLNSSGITVIRGATGEGKTTIFAAIVWALYGKNLKGVSDVNTWKKVQPKDYKGTKVELYFKTKTVNKVIRCLKYKDEVEGAKGGDRLIYYRDANPVDEKYKPQIQALITQDIGMSYNLFINSILFGQGMKRLIQESSSDQKNLFEEIFNLSYLSKAQALAKDKHSDLSTQMEVLTSEERRLKNNLDTIQETLESLKEAEKEVDSIQKNKLKRIEDQLKLSTKRILEFKSKLQDKNPESLNQEIETLESQIDRNEQKLREAKGKSNVSLEDLINQVIKLLEKQDISSSLALLRDIKKAFSIMEECHAKIYALQKTRNNLYSEKRDLQRYMDLLKTEETNLSRFKKEKENLKTDVPDFKSKKKIHKQKRSQIKEKLEQNQTKIQNLREKYDLYKWAYTEPLGNKGLKNFLFESSLDSLNSTLASYSEVLGFHIYFNVDLNTASKTFKAVIMIHGQEVSFDELSGGQKQLVSLAMAFAMNDMMSQSHSINIAFLDEVFEGLSSEPIDTVVSLIRKIYKDRNLFLITHQESLPIPNSKTIRVKNNKGISQYEL